MTSTTAIHTTRRLAIAALSIALFDTSIAQTVQNATETLSRILAEGLQKRYGQPAVVENLAGGAGNIGMDKVRKAKPDGHTLLVVPAGNLTINPTLMPNFPFNVDKDFAPITMLAKAPNVLVASSASSIKNVKDLIAAAKAKPDSLSYASPGVGSGLHLAGELFKALTGTDILHVPYKGAVASSSRWASQTAHARRWHQTSPRWPSKACLACLSPRGTACWPQRAHPLPSQSNWPKTQPTSCRNPLCAINSKPRA